MAWYRTGTVAVTNGSTTVTGTGTDFVGNARVGQGIILPDGRTYEIAAIVSATQITLGTAYLGSTASGQPFVILPTRGPELDLVQQIAALIWGCTEPCERFATEAEARTAAQAMADQTGHPVVILPATRIVQIITAAMHHVVDGAVIAKE